MKTAQDLIQDVLWDVGGEAARFIGEDSAGLPFRAPGTSPIEEVAGMSLWGMVCLYNINAAINGRTLTAHFSRHTGENYDGLRTRENLLPFMVWHQVKVDNYRADFVIRFDHGGVVKWLGVECDGHDYHNLTKEQAEHDRARDRHFQARGLHILRFTGSEIWRDPIKIGFEVLEFCTGTGKA